MIVQQRCVLHASRWLVLLSAVLAMVGVRARTGAAADSATHAASASLVTSYARAATSGSGEVAIAAALNGGSQLVESATRLTRLTGGDAGGHRHQPAAENALQLHHTVRSELNYLTALLRRRSGADPGYTSTPPPVTVRT